VIEASGLVLYKDFIEKKHSGRLSKTGPCITIELLMVIHR